MYVSRIPNRNSNPTWLIRESKWVDGTCKKRTLANITRLPANVRDDIQRLLKGSLVVDDLLDAFQAHYTVTRRLPHGHILCALGTLKKLKLDRIIDPVPSRMRTIAVALIVSRIVQPRSKLATLEALSKDSLTSSLSVELGLEDLQEHEVYAAMDWLYGKKEAIERKLARQHLKEGSTVLCDLTSTYVEGHGADLAEFGYSRDRKKGKKQINFSLLCDAEGRPVAVRAFPGNTADPSTLTAQLDTLQQQFGLSRAILVGDRGLLTNARLREEVQPAGYDWITALRKPAIRKLMQQDAIQLSLFDETDLAEITSDAYPNERLVVCRNPFRADHAAAARQRLLLATEKKLAKLQEATARERNPLRGKEQIALQAGALLGKYKMKKHFKWTITDTSFTFQRDEKAIALEASLDGLYVVRTSVPQEALPAETAVATYKQLSGVEAAFRSIKTMDLQVRPIYHYKADRIKSHLFLCMLAYYVLWHMKKKLAPMLYAEEDPEGTSRASVVAPRSPSTATKTKVRTKTTQAGSRALSFPALMDHMALLSKDELQAKDGSKAKMVLFTPPTKLQAQALKLLGVRLK